MKKLLLLPLSLTLAVSSCKKSDPAPEGAASGAAAPGAAVLGALGALKGFEGEITVLMKSTKEHKPVPPITLTVKGAKLRFDVPEGVENGPHFGRQAHMIVNAPEKKLLAVVDDRKQVIVIGLDTIGQQIKAMPHAPGEPPVDRGPSKVTKTGQTDTVAGYRCEEWEVTSAKGERARVCVSSEDASWFEMPTLGLPSEHAWAKELFDGHHLPLRLVAFDAAGAEETRIEVTKLDKKSVADSVFEAPAGYQVMDMGAMMGAMMGGMMGAGMTPPGAPGASPAGLPPGVQLPPGLKLPPGVQMPPNMPANAADMMRRMQEQAKAAGVQLPPPK